MRPKVPLTLLVIAIPILVLLSFMPDSRKAVTSSEVHFSEISKHGLNIMPASCALSPNYFHVALFATTDGGGYAIGPTESQRGAYASNAGMYVCVVSNNTSNTFFIPARSAAELQAFKNASAALGVPTY